VSLTQNYLQSGKLSPLVALISPHLLILFLAVGLLLWRSQWFMQQLGHLSSKSSHYLGAKDV
jgi:hypothetical protein